LRCFAPFEARPLFAIFPQSPSIRAWAEDDPFPAFLDLPLFAYKKFRGAFIGKKEAVPTKQEELSDGSRHPSINCAAYYNRVSIKCLRIRIVIQRLTNKV